MNYDTLVTYRDEDIDGVRPSPKGWLWPTLDTGAWEGPRRDWLNANKSAYLKYVETTGVVVQAGGNCGMYPRLFAEIFDQVYTFEPDGLNFYCLAANCNKPNIIKMQATLGNDHAMTGVERRAKDNVGMIVASLSGEGDIPMLRIDDLKLRRCDLIQLDTEGTEGLILEGASQTIHAHRPVISVEVPSQSVRTVLDKYGYETRGRIASLDEIFVPKGLTYARV